MFAYKMSACEVCIIWRKPTEALKNPSPIAESRTGKPAMVTLKIQLDCSTVHDTTLWANIYVCSHVGCGTDSVSIRFCKSHKYFKVSKFDLEGKGQSPPKLLGPSPRSFTSMVILAWTGLELSRGQASDWHTDGQTDAGNDNTRWPYWPRVKNGYFFLNYIFPLSTTWGSFWSNSGLLLQALSAWMSYKLLDTLEIIANVTLTAF